MHVIGLYVATLVAFLLIDLVWLRAVALPLFERHIGAIMRDKPDMAVAAGFYAVYVAGIVYFAAAPALGDPMAAFRDGVILGLMAYGTYEATNFATLKGWHWTMAVSDTLWGAFLSGLSAALAVWLLG
jgi:uncharacterized membrane protein